MGQNDRDQARKEDRKRKAEGTSRRRSNKDPNAQKADWFAVDSALLQKAVAAVADAGGAIQFSFTRDGGAYAIRILDNGDVSAEYYPPSTDMNEVMKGIIEDYDTKG